MGAGTATDRQPSPWRGDWSAASGVNADYFALGGLGLVVAMLFHSAILGRGVFYYRDITLFWQPQVDAFVRCLAAGSWPVWNPYVAFGRPLLANPNVQVFYPPTWLNLVLRPGTFYTLYVVAHFLFTASGFYLLARRVRLSPGAAFVGAAVWAASGPLTSLVSLWNYLAGACWWPWIFLAADVALESGRARAAAAWGACLAAPILAGSPETALMGTVAVGAFALRRWRWERPWVHPNRSLLRTCAVAAAFALGLSAAQWLPTMAIAVGTARLSLPSEFRTFWSVHPWSLLQLVLNAPLDDLPLRPVVRATLFESREPLLPSLYLGVGALGLVGAALAASRHPLRRFAGVLGLLALLIALGRHTPVYALATVLLPPMHAIRYPAKAMELVAFAWALLCAMGWDAWRAPLGPSGSRWRALVVMPLCLAVALGMASVLAGRFGAEEWGRLLVSAARGPGLPEVLGPATGRLALGTLFGGAVLALAWRHARGGPRAGAEAALVGLLVVADLVAAHRDPSPLAPPEVFTSTPPAVEAIRAEPHSRIYSYDYIDQGLALRNAPLAGDPETMARPRREWATPWAQALAVRERVSPYLLGVWGLQGSFDRDTLSLFPPYLRWLNIGERISEGTPAMSKVLRMGSVSHVVALHDRGFESLVPVARIPTLLVEPVRIFRVTDPLPRVYAVGGARIGPGRVALRVLADPGFDPAREVILAEGTATPPADGFQASTQVLGWGPDRSRVEARLAQPGYLVFVEGYDPGWHALLDGRTAPVLRADIALSAVAVPGGTHVVEMAYRPLSITLGLAVSALSVAVGAVMAASARRPRLLP